MSRYHVIAILALVGLSSCAQEDNLHRPVTGPQSNVQAENLELSSPNAADPSVLLICYTPNLKTMVVIRNGDKGAAAPFVGNITDVTSKQRIGSYPLKDLDSDVMIGTMCGGTHCRKNDFVDVATNGKKFDLKHFMDNKDILTLVSAKGVPYSIALSCQKPK